MVALSVQVVRVSGTPEFSRICTWFIEHGNLSLRMGHAASRSSLTRSARNLMDDALVRLYSFCRGSKSLRVTTAMEAGTAGLGVRNRAPPLSHFREMLGE